ncbi:MAG TPA: flavin reductase [Acetobacteraceae bacterium]|nr:flavin reductase [Acetobacteraceae bacterium]
MTTNRQEFRNAMARLGAAVTIVTSDGPAGRGGVTASAVCSVTDDPPTLLICMNRQSRTGAIIKGNGVLCVNVLSAGQRDLCDLFAGFTQATPEQRFAAGRWYVLETGAPALDGAVAALDCRIADVVEKGTHSVIFAEVVEIRLGETAQPGLIYFARGYHGVGQED